MNNHSIELYESICNAKIKESIFLVTKLILKDKDTDKSFGIIINTFIAVCSYIGAFISLYDIQLFVNVCYDIKDFIDNDKILIKDVYMIICKLSIICDIYIKNPITKTGTTNVKLLRPKIIDMFELDKFKLSDTGTTLFNGVLPPIDSHTYTVALQIITGYVYIVKQLDSLSADSNEDVLVDIANKIRKSFDYIIRKKYTFETKFYESDNDAVWFLWGIISLLYQDRDMDILYEFFNINYCKKTRNHRIGLLWAAAINMVYIKKRDIGRNWNAKELQIITKIDEISMQLYRDIKKDLIQNNEIEDDIQNKQKSSINGLEYIMSVRHNMIDSKSNIQNDQDKCTLATHDVKYIKCKK